MEPYRRRFETISDELFRNFDKQENKMISDILFECVVELDTYLNSQTYDGRYQRDLRERIIGLRNEAEYIRVILDVPPDCALPPEPVLLERIAAQRDRRIEDRRYVLASEADALGWHRPGIFSSEATNDQ